MRSRPSECSGVIPTSFRFSASTPLLPWTSGTSRVTSHPSCWRLNPSRNDNHSPRGISQPGALFEFSCLRSSILSTPCFNSFQRGWRPHWMIKLSCRPQWALFGSAALQQLSHFLIADLGKFLIPLPDRLKVLRRVQADHVIYFAFRTQFGARGGGSHGHGHHNRARIAVANRRHRGAHG